MFVGNLSFNTTVSILEDLFAKYGSVNSVRIIQNYYGRSKGFGYIEFQTVAQANAALALNGHTLDERDIRVDISTQRPYEQTAEKSAPRERRQPARRVRKTSGNSNSNPRPRAQRKQEPRIEVPREQSTTLFIGNMSWNTKEETL